MNGLTKIDDKTKTYIGLTKLDLEKYWHKCHSQGIRLFSYRNKSYQSVQILFGLHYKLFHNYNQDLEALNDTEYCILYKYLQSP